MGNTNQGRRVGVDDPTAGGHGVGVATSASQFDFEPRTRADSVGQGGGPGSQPMSLSLHARSHNDEAEILNQMVQASAGDEPTLNLHVSGRTAPSGAPPPSPGAHDSSTNKLPTVIRWDGGGKEVFVTGSFSAWKTRIPLGSHSSNVASHPHELSCLFDTSASWPIPRTLHCLPLPCALVCMCVRVCVQ